MSLKVIEISKIEHENFLKQVEGFSFLQLPTWANVKADWQGLSIGFYDDEALIGVGLLLSRVVPKINYSLWYLPEGPVIQEPYLSEVRSWASALKNFAKGKKVFAIKFGPRLIQSVYEKDEIEQAIENGVKTFDELRNEANLVIDELVASGCRQQNQEAGFGDFQPRFIFVKDIAGKSDEALLKEFNQLWRRNIKKAENSEVKVEVAGTEKLAVFHELYKETAKRDGFYPRPLNYFKKMFENLNTELSEIRLYLAFQNEVPLAATIWIKVKNRVWYSYGASANEGREFKPSNAIQWQMIKDARESGSEIYDFRGISDSLDQNNRLFGLLRFKLGTGGSVIKYIGEWDLVLNKFIYRLFMLLLKYRSN